MKYSISPTTTTPKALLKQLGVKEKPKAVWFAYPMATFVTPEQYNDEMGTGFEYPAAAEIDLKKELDTLRGSSAKDRKIVYF